MNRQLGGKSSEEGNGASPLSLLVHAADSQRSSGKNAGKPDSHASSQRDDPAGRIPEGAPSSALEDHMNQRQAAARAEALHHQGLLSQLRGGALGDGGDIFQQNAAIVAAQQQQQAAALALASDIRTAVAAAQLRQAAQFQNQDFLLARTAALQQLGIGGGGTGGAGGMDQIHQELELHRLEEYERRQLLAAAAAGAPMGALAARQQLELQEAQIRQEQLDRQLSQNNDSMLDRAGLRAPSEASGGRGGSAAAEGGNKDSFQKTPGSVVVPCRARGMPMDHNFKTAYFVIPENVEHGEELICSYFACRNAGIKFRYCTHCKVPVAKRNFRKRHKHGKPNTNDLDEDGSVEEEDEVVTKAKKDAAQAEQKKAEAYLQEVPKKLEMPPKVVEEPNPSRNKDTGGAPPSKKSKTKESRLVSDDNDAPALPKISHQSRPKIGADRERLWAQLLAKRPPTKDGEAVSAWLMEVLSVSDLDTPLKENGQAQPAGAISLPFKTAGATTDAAQLAAASFKQNKSARTEANAEANPEDSNKDKEKDKAETDTSSASSSSSNMIIKKKRPLAMLQKEEKPRSAAAAASPKTGGSKKDVGSFAEWKDRKKHKGLPKKGFSMQQSE